jgi:hypothetical protein
MKEIRVLIWYASNLEKKYYRYWISKLRSKNEGG